MNASSGWPASSRSRWTAPATLARMTLARSAVVRSGSGGSAGRTPAACTTAVSGASAGTDASSARTSSSREISQATIVTRVPREVSSACSAAAPGAAGPRRLASTTCGAPRSASQPATREPITPVPPVTSTVPRGRQGPAAGASLAGARAIRRAKTPDGRIATWSSPSAPASSLARWPAAAGSAGSARSARPPQLPG